MKKMSLFIAVLGVLVMLTACGSTAPGKTQETAAPETTQETFPPETATEPTVAETTPQVYQAAFSELQALLGMPDAETADLLGGGEENWTEDRQFYIGRNYTIQLKDRVSQVHTTCDENNTVNSVSVWLSDGETPVSKDEVDTWVAYLTEYAGVEPAFDGTTSEVGSQNWKWVTEDAIITLNWLDTIFSFSMNPKVGELN